MYTCLAAEDTRIRCLHRAKLYEASRALPRPMRCSQVERLGAPCHDQIGRAHCPSFSRPAFPGGPSAAGAAKSAVLALSLSLSALSRTAAPKKSGRTPGRNRPFSRGALSTAMASPTDWLPESTLRRPSQLPPLTVQPKATRKRYLVPRPPVWGGALAPSAAPIFSADGGLAPAPAVTLPIDLEAPDQRVCRLQRRGGMRKTTLKPLVLTVEAEDAPSAGRSSGRFERPHMAPQTLSPVLCQGLAAGRNAAVRFSKESMGSPNFTPWTKRTFFAVDPTS